MSFNRIDVIRWYWRFLWGLALFLIYVVIVEYQLTGSIYQMLLIQQNASKTIFGMRNVYDCFPPQPQGVSFNDFLFAANPHNWGSTLTSYMEGQYCTTNDSEAVARAVGGIGSISPPPIGANGLGWWNGNAALPT